MINFKKSSFLITGGTGSFGFEFVKRLISLKAGKIVIFSRDELKQFEMRSLLKNVKNVSYIIGDVRDKDSIKKSLKNVDYVFHAAALKQVPSGELFPIETVNTNVIGTKNTIESAIESNVKKLILLSTDKAVYPINAMGMTKSIAEKILIAESRLLGKNSKTSLCITRYGNVMMSRGSVIPYFIERIKSGLDITITDERMTRFIMTLNDAIGLVEYAFRNGKNGCTYVRKSPSVKIIDLAVELKKILKSKSKIKNIGIRPGEKLYETLISDNEINRAKEKKLFYEISPNVTSIDANKFFYKGNTRVKNLTYSSNNIKLLKNYELHKLLKTTINNYEKTKC